MRGSVRKLSPRANTRPEFCRLQQKLEEIRLTTIEGITGGMSSDPVDYAIRESYRLGRRAAVEELKEQAVQLNQCPNGGWKCQTA